MRPGLGLSGIREQVHDDGTLGDGLVDLEEVLAGNPAVLNGILPRLAILADTNDDVDAVVTEVETLAVTLRAVADESESVVLEVVLWEWSLKLAINASLKRTNQDPVESQLVEKSRIKTYLELLNGPVGTLVDILLVTGKVDGLDTAGLLLSNGGSGAGDGSSADSTGGGNEGASLDGGGGHLASQRAQGLLEVSGGRHVDSGLVWWLRRGVGIGFGKKEGSKFRSLGRERGELLIM